MYPRHLTQALLTALSNSPVVFLNGARQTGKSTRRSLPAGPHPARYLTLDIQVLAAQPERSTRLSGGHRGPVILDEIQGPELFLPLKAEVAATAGPGTLPAHRLGQRLDPSHGFRGR